MKNRFIAFAAILFISMATMAQSSMTDDQVLKYLVTEAQKGTSQQKMASELLKKGVTPTQLQRVRKKAEKLRDEAESTGKKDKKKDKKGKKDDYNLDMDASQSRAEELGLEQSDDELIGESTDDILGITEEDQRQVFGRNIFNAKNLTFQPSANLATPANYTIGPADMVTINIWGASQQTIEAEVSADGYIVIEGVGPIKLAGQTVERAKSALRNKLSQHYSDCSIDLSLSETRSIQVQVMGEVKVPGTYTLSSLSTAFNALYMAGGISKIGTLRDIKVYRGGKNISTIDVYDYILNGNSRGDIRLEDNDVIVVGAYNCLVQVKGNVKRPMWYEMKKSETVKDLLTYAGSFTGNAYTKNVRLTRKSGDEYSIHTIDEFQMGSFAMADEDMVEVDSIRARFSNKVEVRGAAKHPGLFELGGKIQSVRDLLLAAEGLSEDAYEGRAIMHRENEDLTLRMINVDIHGIIAGTTSDIPLKKNDVLFIPSKSDMLGERLIDVKGEVTYPGQYPYADNTTIQDIILQTGGLTEAGSLARVDVFRRIRDNKSSLAGANNSINFSFSLDERFAIQEDTTFFLEPYDIVVVRKSPSYKEQQNVTAQGEVNFEGQYSLTNKNYRLSDLVKACGGLTDMAYIRGAKLTRLMTPEELEQRDQANLKAQIQLYEDGLKEGKDMNMVLADSLLSLKTNTSNTFPVAINLEKAMTNPGSDDDILLREGDILSVPEKSNIIKISGEVMYPVSMSYEKGKNLSYYIHHAGGYSTNASKRKVYGINANGSVVKLSSNSVRDIEPGMEIVVPQKSAKKKLSTTEIIGIGSGVAALASVIVALLNAIK
ncbi:MAG: SLBB domain-containing protein [Bacteroidaceae bacterium]|nr:SLBB domain-containing protein [Bacteroidaceae bacterium]